jgi:polyphosphate kinase
VNFLNIVTSNLDEFVMKRVGGLKHQKQYNMATVSLDGLSVQEQLDKTRISIQALLDEQAGIYKEITKELDAHSVVLKKWKDLNAKEKQFVRDFYTDQVFPVLTPLMVDPALPFPFISNLTISLAVSLKFEGEEELQFARVKVPEVFPQWVNVDIPENKNKNVFVSLVQVIQYNLEDLFPDAEVKDVMPFRITRNADLEHDEEDAEDLLELISEEIRQRRFADVVRLEHGKNSNPWMIQFLKDELELEDEHIYQVKGLLDYTSLKPIAALNIPHLRYKHWEPQTPQALTESTASMFEVIKRQDLFVHHPYESFPASVERFVSQAARDPNVLAIKMTLYRMGDANTMIQELIKAAELGKQVVCIVELKARFDEQRNINWAQKMEKAGIHVVYGVIGYKTHCKTTLVLRREGSGIVSYAHIGTGNYNPVTSRVYTDIGLLTANKKITEDLVQLFHLLTGRSFKRHFKSLLVAPVNMKEKYLELIEREKRFAEHGKPSRIVVKCNSLEDKEIIESLYEASQLGVHVDLIVRGFCTLRPGLPGLSERIRVISVIGRFLEHSRIFYFQNGEEKTIDGEFYIGSADWMYRNLHTRVEVAVPIFERKIKRRIWEILNASISDHRQVWEMSSAGKYKQRVADGPVGEVGTHERLMQLTTLRTEFAASADSED